VLASFEEEFNRYFCWPFLKEQNLTVRKGVTSATGRVGRWF